MAKVTVYFPKQGARLEGTVVDSSGHPLQGIEVFYDRQGDDLPCWEKVLSGPGGRFQVTGIFAGDYDLLVDRWGYARWGRSVCTMDPPVEIVLERTRAVLFEPVDRSGQPVDWVWVWSGERRVQGQRSRIFDRAHAGRQMVEVPEGEKKLKISVPGQPEFIEVELSPPVEGYTDLGRLYLAE